MPDPRLRSRISQLLVRAPPRRRLVLLGLCGAVITFASLAGTLVAVYPPYLSADEAHHLDHAWRIGHGELPTFHDGLAAPLGVPLPPVQYTWHHPPFFYVLLAPVVTPLLDAGRWRTALLLSRLVVLLFGVLVLLAAAWATNRVIGASRPALVVGAAMVCAVLAPFVGVSSAVYNDTPALLAATIALGLASTMLRRGPTVGSLAALTAVCVVGFATRASFSAILVVVSFATAVGAVHKSRERRVALRAIRAAGSAAVVVVVPLIAVGWFYARNVRLAGSWTGSLPEVWEGMFGRTRRSVIDTVLNGDVWIRGLGGFVPQPVAPEDAARGVRLLGFMVVLAVAGLAAMRAIPGVIRSQAERTDVLVSSLLALATAGTVGGYVQHVANGGAPGSRYLLPALLPICVGGAYGLLAFRRARGLMLIGFCAFCSVLLLAQTVRLLELRRFGPGTGTWEAWTSGVELNGLPIFVLPVLLGLLPLGLTLGAIALWRLTVSPAGSTTPVDERCAHAAYASRHDVEISANRDSQPAAEGDQTRAPSSAVERP